MGLVAPWHVGSSRTKDQTHVPCIDRRILNHCTTREIPEVNFYKKSASWNTFREMKFYYFSLEIWLLGTLLNRDSRPALQSSGCLGFECWLCSLGAVWYCTNCWPSLSLSLPPGKMTIVKVSASWVLMLNALRQGKYWEGRVPGVCPLSWKSEIRKYNLWAKSGPLPVFVNKVLLEHSHAHSFGYNLASTNIINWEQ